MNITRKVSPLCTEALSPLAVFHYPPPMSLGYNNWTLKYSFFGFSFFGNFMQTTWVPESGTMWKDIPELAPQGSPSLRRTVQLWSHDSKETRRSPGKLVVLRTAHHAHFSPEEGGRLSQHQSSDQQTEVREGAGPWAAAPSFPGSRTPMGGPGEPGS